MVTSNAKLAGLLTIIDKAIRGLSISDKNIALLECSNLIQEMFEESLK